jgi:hypothetical protein
MWKDENSGQKDIYIYYVASKKGSFLVKSGSTDTKHVYGPWWSHTQYSVTAGVKVEWSPLHCNVYFIQRCNCNNT